LRCGCIDDTLWKTCEVGFVGYCQFECFVVGK
jgi:hypothetical protein